jgi:hypothetical protein
MSGGSIDRGRDAPRDAAWTLPLEEINLGQPALFQAGAMRPYFERPTKEHPARQAAVSAFRPCWSITRHDDIMGGRHQPSGVFLRFSVRRDHHRGRA